MNYARRLLRYQTEILCQSYLTLQEMNLEVSQPWQHNWFLNGIVIAKKLKQDKPNNSLLNKSILLNHNYNEFILTK